ncbi:hypothetical protein [Streptomyces gibsoniae]|uniref:Integral membrane protein n=1 Tax=Streptomyces gibsoniae TaxID=3075529 RepID=A0ABU2U2W7_9ACTN|nr:hypothetical protein [Streptomyces sp. DSM 41699]MDT0467568.1 hypothetical protein [Streptomyces sp. DSM 41699]
METFAGPSILIVAAAVILAVKYRRRLAGRQPLRVTSTMPGRIAVAVAFLAGCAWAWSQGPSVINAGVLGLSLALLVGAAAEFLMSRTARR